jgi:outer membrane protein
MRIILLSSLVTAAWSVGVACAQQPLTPPIQPKVTPVVTPPSIVVPPPPGAPGRPTPITANEAAIIALKHQPQIAIAAAAIRSAHGNVLEAEQLLLPTVAITAGYGRTYSLPFVGTPTTIGLLGQGLTTSASLTQLLFDFGKTVDGIREAEANEKSADYSLTMTESDSVLTVKQDFYTYVQDLRAVDVADANIKDRQDNLSLAQARLNSGIGEPGDVVTAQTNLAAATVTLITARTTASTEEVALALAMGIDPRTPIIPKDSEEKDIAIDNVDALVDQALKQRPEIKVQQQLLRAAGYAVSVARKSLLPTIDLTVGTQDVGSIGGSLGYLNPTAVAFAVSLTWDPFNIVGEHGHEEVARASADTARQNLILASQNIVSDISTAYLDIKTAEQRITTSQSEIANGLEGLRIAEGQYKAGVATFVTVTDAETNLAQARTDLVTSTAALQLALSAMEHAIGKPL